MPDSDAQGISRRLPDEERTRLRSLVDEARPDSMGVIVRTAAEEPHAATSKRTSSRLVGTWAQIREAADAGGAPDSSTKSPSCSFG